MSKTPRQDALQPPAPLPLIRKSEWWAIIGLLISCVVFVSFILWRNKPVSYTIQCAVMTPSGPVPTISLKARDVYVTEFGIIKSKEGLYIPTTSEICVISKEDKE